MVTVPRLNKAFVDNMRTAFSMLGFPEGRCFLQDYDESFYYYALSQKPDFWSRKRWDCFLSTGRRLTFNLCPSTSSRSRRWHPYRGENGSSSIPCLNREDLQFCELIQDSLGNDIYSSIFLIGNGFDRTGRCGRSLCSAKTSGICSMEIICTARGAC